ncbi:MAG: hypothetical protein ACI86M_001156 [Saprospiraceae bacterium]|jgi:hypothetical protein
MDQEKEDNYLKIRRKYRISVSDELKNFWDSCENNKLFNGNINFNFHKIQLLPILDIIDFDIRIISSWFKEKSELKYIIYYLPIAKIIYTDNILIIGYDRNKIIKGVFLFNGYNNPIFLTNELQEILTLKITQTQDKFEYLKKRIPSQFIFIEDEDPYDYEEDARKPLLSLLEFIKKCFSKVVWSEVIEITETEGSINLKILDNRISNCLNINKEEVIGHDESVTILNFFNSYIWTHESVIIKTYGFYKIDEGVVFLFHDELIEFTRLGVMSFLYNVIFPSFLFIDRVNNYKYNSNKEEDESMLDLTTSEVFDYYENVPPKIEVKKATDISIVDILDYYFDSTSSELLLDGIDELKITSEEALYSEIESNISANDFIKRRFYAIWYNRYQLVSGHCYFQKTDIKDDFQFQFYCQAISWEDKDITDDYINTSIKYISTKLNPKTITSKVNSADSKRIEILKRNDFKQVMEEIGTINKIGLKQSIVVLIKTLP